MLPKHTGSHILAGTWSCAGSEWLAVGLPNFSISRLRGEKHKRYCYDDGINSGGSHNTRTTPDSHPVRLVYRFFVLSANLPLRLIKGTGISAWQMMMMMMTIGHDVGMFPMLLMIMIMRKRDDA